MTTEQDKSIYRRIGLSAGLGFSGMAAGFVASFPLGYKFPYNIPVAIADLVLGAFIGAIAKQKLF